MKPAIALTDSERFPLLNDLSFLNELKQDACAPAFNFQSGDRLTAVGLEKVREYEKSIRYNRTFWEESALPQWMDGFMHHCVSTVPFYKARPLSFLSQPTINRSQLAAAPWQFVSSQCPANDLLVYQTSGTTGAPMDVLFNAVSQACWLPQLQSVLDRRNIQLSADPRKVAVALICAQSATLTYASLSTYLHGAGILKINLSAADWKNPSHPNAFLEKYNPEVLTGDPFALAALLSLRPALRPKAMVSSAMKLTTALRLQLEAHFGCPVFDIYSLTECRMIAVAEGEAHRAIRPDLYLEVFDKDADVLLPYGSRGELVVSGGNNPFLPLVRYRTGDFCSLQLQDGVPYLLDLEGREAVAFYTRQQKPVNNIDVSRALMNCTLAGFHLHQNKDYSLRFTGWSNGAVEEKIEEVLYSLFGDDIEMNIVIKKMSEAPLKKVVSYTSEVKP